MIMSFFKDKLQWIFAVVSLLVITTGCVSQNSSRAQLSVAADSNGFKVSNQLFDISVFSKVIACEPPWRANRFYTMIDPIRCEINSNGGRIIQDGKFDEINFKEYSVKFNGNSGVMTLDMELLKELPTFMEYTIFVLPENLLAGAEFTAETADGKIVSGSVPVSFGSSTEIVYLVKDAVKFSASNNYGTFQFDVVEGKPFTVADRRGVPFENMRCYWIGNDGDMVKGVPVKSVVNFSYTINPELKIAAPEYGDGKVNAVQKKELFSSRRIGRPLLPAPKVIRYADGVLTGNFAGPEFAGSNALSEQDAAKLERAAERLGLTGNGGAPHFTAELRKKLPKDIIFTVWRYSGDFETFDDMKALAQDGFPVIGASWYATNNVENFTRFAREQNAMGMLSTTWIYTPNKDNYYYWFHQMAPYVRSGCWSWNVSSRANENLNAAKVFCDLHENAKPEEKHDGFTLDINGIANLSITGANNPFLSGITYGLDELGCGEKRCGNVLFDVAGKNGYTAAAAVKSSINPGFPEEIALENLNLKAEKLFFLHSSIGSIPPLYSNIASYTIYYKDGSTVEYPVKYGMEVGVPGADYNYYLSTGNAVELPFDGEISKVWYSVWNNPQPDKIIARIVLKSSGQPYYLFGISGF